VLERSGIPTRALYDAFRAEGETYESVGRWYAVEASAVREAVQFETELTKQAA
jgi:hypothetical protein